MFQRKGREGVTDFGPETKKVRSKDNRWLLKGGCGSQSYRVLGLHPFLTQEAVLHVLSAFVCVSRTREKAHPATVVTKAEGTTHQTSRQILWRPSRDAPTSSPCCWAQPALKVCIPEGVQNPQHSTDLTQLCHPGKGIYMRQVMGDDEDFL